VNHGDGFNYVYSTRSERLAIARHLGLSLSEFERKYCEKVGAHLSFISEDNACVFLKDGKCSVYQHRPAQCSTFPFWPELLRDKDTWEEDVASFCPGVGQGPVHDQDEIEAVMRRARF
jgi:Fe-S-cluster containining protein